MKVPGDLNTKGGRENNHGHVWSSCVVRCVLAPVKQEILESTNSFKGRQQHCVQNETKHKQDLQPEGEHPAQKRRENKFWT